MKLNKSATELLNRYMLGVKRELGGRERDDIAAEIESYIYDLLEERHPGDREIGREELETILKEMGSPRKVAGQYSPQRYLIGPRLFPVYWLVLRIVAAVVAGALTLSLVIASSINPPADLIKTFVEFLSTIFDGILSAAASITIVFAIIERATEGKRLEEIEELKELKIDELPELPEEEKPFSLVGISIEAALGVLGLAFFSYIRGTGGALPVILNPNTQMHMARVFTDHYLGFIPVILGLTGLEVARNVTLLVQARHSSITNWWDIALKAGSMVLSGFMLGALPLVTLDYFQSIFQVSDLNRWNATANTALAVILGLSIFGNLIEVIRKIVREIRNPAY
ncbi:MAG: hypothetical protein HPY72_03590 [Anaerolineae bacterium]|jgi:hypothetical protein|nr:hypothetical protein [Anaerolineae bacterium]